MIKIFLAVFLVGVGEDSSGRSTAGKKNVILLVTKQGPQSDRPLMGNESSSKAENEEGNFAIKGGHVGGRSPRHQ